MVERVSSSAMPLKRLTLMTLSEAWKIFQPELQAVYGDNWSEDDYTEDPDKRQLAHDVEMGAITNAVLSEIENCLTRDWCAGRVLTAALTVLAAHNKLDEFRATDVYSQRPKTRIILGKRYVVG
jgi:hypothetical protein